MTTNTDFAKYISRFFSDYLLHERGASKNTVASYRDAFIQFIDYMKEQKGIPVEKLLLTDLTNRTVVDYLNWLVDTRKCSISTRNYRLAAIHAFVSYLQYVSLEYMDEWQKIKSIKSIRCDSHSPNYLTIDGIKQLFEQPDFSTVNGRRHLAIMSLMYATGARVSEMANLQIQSVQVQTKPYTVKLVGKGNKARIVPLLDEDVKILHNYMEEHHLFEVRDKSVPLFQNRRNEKMTRSGLTYILNTYVAMAKQLKPELFLGTVSCHSLRHSKAMHLLQAGVPLIYIRDILGHVSSVTTEVYARADSKAKREAIEKAYTQVNPNIVKEREWEKDNNLRTWLKAL